jgi:hypothetical protein
MIDYTKWIFAISVGVIGAYIYYRSKKKNDSKRPKNYIGHICPRCRQGFSRSELFQIWQFPTAPLRLMGWNKDHELDLLYCKKCRKILNTYMAISIFLSLPMLMLLVYFAAHYLGIIDE